MNPNFGNQSQGPFDYSTANTSTVAQASPEVRLNFIRKTYALFMAAILASIVTGAICLNTPLYNVAIGILQARFLVVILVFGGSILASSLSQKEGWNYIALFGFTSFLGFLMAPVLAMYEMMAPGIVGQAAFLTTIVFGSLTAYAFVTRQDFNYLGGILFVAMIGWAAAMLGNYLFFHNNTASYWIAWVTLVLFSGFVLYDTSQIIHRFDEKGYCTAALHLFIDFFNLFMAILRILSGSRR